MNVKHHFLLEFLLYCTCIFLCLNIGPLQGERPGNSYEVQDHWRQHHPCCPTCWPGEVRAVQDPSACFHQDWRWNAQLPAHSWENPGWWLVFPRWEVDNWVKNSILNLRSNGMTITSAIISFNQLHKSRALPWKSRFTCRSAGWHTLLGDLVAFGKWVPQCNCHFFPNMKHLQQCCCGAKNMEQCLGQVFGDWSSSPWAWQMTITPFISNTFNKTIIAITLQIGLVQRTYQYGELSDCESNVDGASIYLRATRSAEIWWSNNNCKELDVTFVDDARDQKPYSLDWSAGQYSIVVEWVNEWVILDYSMWRHSEIICFANTSM